MHRPHSIGAIVAWALALAFFGSAQPAASSQHRTLSTRVIAAQPAAKHLYVVDYYYKLVYRFALGPDGLPATKPDGVLRGFVSPFEVAFDGNGEMYVADIATVKVFSPGAVGYAKPIRTVRLRGASVQLLAVEHRGGLVIARENQDGSEPIDVFAPGADGFARPVHSIAYLGPGDSIKNLILDARGRLFVVSQTALVEFTDPLHDVQPTSTIVPDAYEFSWGQALAFDESSDDLYANFTPRAEGPGYTADDFGVRPVHSRPVSPDRLVLTKECHDSEFYSGSDPSAVISGDYLIFTCQSLGAVYVYRKGGDGRHRLVESVGAGLFFSPFGIAIGP